MIALPPTFDAILYASDITTLVLPFVGIAALFMGFAVIKKIGNHLK